MNKELILKGVFVASIVLLLMFLWVMSTPLSTDPTGKRFPVSQGEIEKEAAEISCGSLCNETLNSGKNLSNGPCISNEIWSNGPDWVCDIAHNPREAVDNLPENQCSSYRNGAAHHFVEVDENCNLIRAV